MALAKVLIFMAKAFFIDFLNNGINAVANQKKHYVTTFIRYQWFKEH